MEVKESGKTAEITGMTPRYKRRLENDADALRYFLKKNLGLDLKGVFIMSEKEKHEICDETRKVLMKYVKYAGAEIDRISGKPGNYPGKTEDRADAVEFIRSLNHVAAILVKLDACERGELPLGNLTPGF